MFGNWGKSQQPAAQQPPMYQSQPAPQSRQQMAPQSRQQQQPMYQQQQQPMYQQQPPNNSMNSASFGLSLASLGASAAAAAAKSAFSGVNQGLNLVSLVSEMRNSFNPQQQSDIAKAVVTMLSSLSSRTLAKNNVAGVRPKDIMINKLTAASLDAARSALNGMLTAGGLGKQAFGLIGSQLQGNNQYQRNNQYQGNNQYQRNNQYQGNNKYQGGKTYKRKHQKKHKKSRRRI